MRHFNGWDILTIVTLTLLIGIFSVFKIQSGVIVICIVQGFYLGIMVNVAEKDDDLTRKQIEDARKGNY